MPAVSVIIPTYNGALFIAETIESVLAQTHRDFEIIVVDDGSTDETSRILRQFGEHLKVLTSDRNGIPAARNRGVRFSNGRYLCFLDHDDLWKPDKLARQVKIFDQHPEVGFCFTDYETFGDPVSYQVGFEENGGQVRTLPRQQIGVRSYKITSPSLFIDMVNGALPCWTSTVMMRRSMLDQVGPFDEKLVINDDTQMWLRFAKRCAFAYVDEPVVRQRVRRSSASLSMSLEKKHADSIWMFERLGMWTELNTSESRAVVKRRAALLVGLGYLHFQENELQTAKAHFRKSLGLDFSSRGLWYYLLTFLPESGVRHLRLLKQKLSA